jgi:hypothetical protein
MATTTPNFGWAVPTSTDLVKDGAVAIETLGDSIDASLVDLKGGTTGQVLAKASGTDMDFSWVAQDDSNAIQNAIVDAKGDLIAATANDTPARLAVGTNGQVLTADSTAATGLKWAAVASGGKVLQVVQGTVTSDFTTTSGTLVDTGLTVTITPSSASSKVLVLVSVPSAKTLNTVTSATNNYSNFAVIRGTTQLQSMLIGYFGLAASNYPQIYQSISSSYLDSPATTSATTYKVQARKDASTDVAFNGSATTINSITVLEIGA